MAPGAVFILHLFQVAALAAGHGSLGMHRLFQSDTGAFFAADARMTGDAGIHGGVMADIATFRCGFMGFVTEGDRGNKLPGGFACADSVFQP